MKKIIGKNNKSKYYINGVIGFTFVVESIFDKQDYTINLLSNNEPPKVGRSLQDENEFEFEINMESCDMITENKITFLRELLKIPYLNPSKNCFLESYLNDNQIIYYTFIEHIYCDMYNKNNIKFELKKIISMIMNHENFDISDYDTLANGSGIITNSILKLIINHPLFDLNDNTLEKLFISFSKSYPKCSEEYCIEIRKMCTTIISHESFDFFYKSDDLKNILMLSTNTKIKNDILSDIIDLKNSKKINISLKSIINEKDENGRNILHYLNVMDIECINKLIDLPYFDKKLFLTHNNTGELPFLLKSKLLDEVNIFHYDSFYNYISINEVDQNKNSYLHIIISKINSVLEREEDSNIYKKNYQKTLQNAIHKININHQNIDGNTILHTLCNHDFVITKKELIFEFIAEIINIILNTKNIDPRLLNNENLSPFDLAIKNKNYKIANYLITHPKYKESLFNC
jgi:hypothetical protein